MAEAPFPMWTADGMLYTETVTRTIPAFVAFGGNRCETLVYKLFPKGDGKIEAGMKLAATGQYDMLPDIFPDRAAANLAIDAHAEAVSAYVTRY